ncbi:phage shock protein A (PspA) family protein [Alteromonadaceae bacterium Bs31]|nr:phage shock protein A (PspA) family protein [Alteromonadaceae bacterium Bs31]
MKLQRLFASINGQFEALVNSVENHQAVAESAIKDLRVQTARINAQLKQSQHRLELLLEREHKISQQRELWKDRAKRSAEESREQALRCLSAMKNCEGELLSVEEQRERSQRLVSELQSHLNEAEKKLLDLQSRKDSLSARSARNQVVKAFSQETALTENTDAVFMRWEEKVIADEYVVPAENLSTDRALDTSFKAQEDRACLEAELDELLGSANKAEQGVAS